MTNSSIRSIKITPEAHQALLRAKAEVARKQNMSFSELIVLRFSEVRQ